MSLDTTDIIMARVYLTEGAHELDNILAYLRDESNIRLMFRLIYLW
jgi:hypothetical protein